MGWHDKLQELPAKPAIPSRMPNFLPMVACSRLAISYNASLFCYLKCALFRVQLLLGGCLPNDIDRKDGIPNPTLQPLSKPLIYHPGFLRVPRSLPAAPFHATSSRAISGGWGDRISYDMHVQQRYLMGGGKEKHLPTQHQHTRRRENHCNAESL